MYIRSDSCYCDNQCMYDPDGSYCYTHGIYENEHNRQIRTTRKMRAAIVPALTGLLDCMNEDGFEPTEIHILAGTEIPFISITAKDQNSAYYHYRAYISIEGKIEFDA